MKHSLKNLFVAALAVPCYMSAPAALANTEKRIELHNTTGTVIVNVFFSETWSTNWSPDVLEGTIGQDTIKIVRVMSGACLIDMRVRYANDVRHDLRFDICRAEHVDATPTGLNVIR